MNGVRRIAEICEPKAALHMFTRNTTLSANAPIPGNCTIAANSGGSLSMPFHACDDLRCWAQGALLQVLHRIQGCLVRRR